MTGAVSTKTSTKENTMLLLHEELARSHQRRLLAESRRSGRAARLVAARRWSRRAEAASRRARALSLAVW
ncbi:MAG TPA: hypothetical protein VFQ85_12155 [Mycobacteriales bacterium]|jgi:hypothetical protein|nr:hypothetical protein [Mycobacteriales bacterium]